MTDKEFERFSKADRLRKRINECNKMLGTLVNAIDVVNSSGKFDTSLSVKSFINENIYAISITDTSVAIQLLASCKEIFEKTKAELEEEYKEI